VADVLLGALDALWRQAVLGLGPVLALGAALYVVQWATHRALGDAIGFRGIVWWTGWLGTPVHEASHYVVGKAFGLDIVEVKPFAPDPDTGVLGYVRYRRPPLRPSSLHKVVGTFAMGIAPLFGGSLVLWGAWMLLVHPAAGGDYAREVRELTSAIASGGLGDLLVGFGELMASLYAAVFQAGADRWQPWVFLYVALAVGAHLAPSTADLRGGLWGFVVLCVLALLANAVALAVGATPASAVGPLARGSAAVAGLLMLALVLNVGNLALSGALAFVANRVRG
jgi:hypothetical protein